jgi:glucosamine-6-phosphate deaminase
VRQIIEPRYEDMSVAAARLVADAIQASPQLTLCLAAGKTPTGMYRELVRLNRDGALDCSAVTFFCLDEYVGLRADHSESFRAYLWREFLGKIQINPRNFHLPDLNYEETIRQAGGIDLLICGIGPNGHLAFNEPGASPISRTRIVDLAESTVEGLRESFRTEEPPRQAVTVGLATIMDSRRILLLAAGRTKAGILARALHGPVSPEVPASILQLHPDLIVLADQAASP